VRLRSRAGTLALVLLAGAAIPGGVLAGNLLLADPDFDDGIGAWMTGAGQASGVADDADDCPQSFAFHGQATGSASPSIVRATASDCIAAQQGDELFLEVRYRSERPLHLFLILYAQPGCATPLIGELGPQYAAAAEWEVARRTIEITSSNVASVRFSALAMDDPGPASFSAEFDRAYLGRVQRIFADDFEGGATCRWLSGG
jgi:hypothetical protein